MEMDVRWRQAIVTVGANILFSLFNLPQKRRNEGKINKRDLTVMEITHVTFIIYFISLSNKEGIKNFPEHRKKEEIGKQMVN